MRTIERALAVAGALGIGWSLWTWAKTRWDRQRSDYSAWDKYERQMY